MVQMFMHDCSYTEPARGISQLSGHLGPQGKKNILFLFFLHIKDIKQVRWTNE